MRLAQAAGIDGFALNMAAGDDSNAASIGMAFQASNQVPGFKLFFSFDYLGWGAWPANKVVQFINDSKGNSSYWKVNGQPLASTFEGVNNIGDWGSIKQQTGAFFMPDWSSMGAQAAANTGVVDGLFSWNAWPAGANNMNANDDKYYKQCLNGKPFMMGVSPWFYTNLPKWSKNFLWRGDDLWYDRWQQVLDVQPEMVEIISWNDYGESHYIGPVRGSGYGLFQSGGAPFNYALNMPHDGWRQFLPYIINQYKTGSTSVSQEGLQAWYRPSPAGACNSAGTHANDAGHGQQEMSPSAVVQDKVFFSALLSSNADVFVTIGGQTQKASWSSTPAGGSGIYHGSAPFNGRGDVEVTISRNGNSLFKVNGGPQILDNCGDGYTKFNAWVGSSSPLTSGGGSSGGGSSTPPSSGGSSGSGGSIPSGVNPVDGSKDNVKCNNGSGEGGYKGLCDFACHTGYCPPQVCTCTGWGAPTWQPAETNQNAYPKAGSGCGYAGLCDYAAHHGYVPTDVCTTDRTAAQSC
jgi:hypothetical protein